VDRQTRAVLDELVGREAPALSELHARDAELLGLLRDAWVDGRIAGFPADESQLDASIDWLLTPYREDEAAFRAEHAARDAATERLPQQHGGHATAAT
jgi:hypothetical protein